MLDYKSLNTVSGIRNALFEAEGAESVAEPAANVGGEEGALPTDEVGMARLTMPLNTAYKNVSLAVTTIGSLKPPERKAASVKLIDIAEIALSAVEKSLKRSGTSDPQKLTKLRRINKLLAEFDDDYTTLQVKEEAEFDGEDPEVAPIVADEDGTPPILDTEKYQSVDPLAVRFLSDNSDMNDPALAKGDPKDPSEPAVNPPEGVATPETLDTTDAEDTIMNTLAAASDQPEDEPKESALPATFKPRGTNESIHSQPSENLRILELICRSM